MFWWLILGIVIGMVMIVAIGRWILPRFYYNMSTKEVDEFLDAMYDAGHGRPSTITVETSTKDTTTISL